LIACGGGGGGSTTQPPVPPPVNPAASAPTFWPLAGTYSPTQMVSLSSSTAGSTIYYTKDGSTPTTSSSKYTDPIAVSSTTTINAIAVASGFSNSSAVSAVYTIPQQGAPGPQVSVVLTTSDQSRRMSAESSINFTGKTASSNVIVVDESQTYQQVDGFGASITDSAAFLLNQVASATDRDAVLNNLFTRNGSGIGLSFLRNPMGASDIARTHYSYDDGNEDPTLANFSIAHDQVDVLPLTLQAKQLNPQLKVMANPWSPPGWMKSSGSMKTGSLMPSMYGPFANYFVKYIEAYKAAGVDIDYISLQNEPLYVPNDYPGMSMDAATQITVLRDYVLPALATNNLTTKVVVYDHNWDAYSYPQTVLADATLLNSPQVVGIAWHGYGGTAGAMTTLQNQFPTKGQFLTEHSGGTWVTNQAKSDFEEITHVMRNWARAYVKWSLALNQTHGPNLGGCNTCTPLVVVNSTSGATSYSIEFYTMGHFSKYVLPGATRVYSNNLAGLVNVAFANADGSKALVVYNDSNATQSFSVQWGSQSFAYTLPAYAGATFSWTGAQTGVTLPLSAKSQIQASSYNSVSGLQTETSSDANGGYDLGFSGNGSYALYKNVDFGSGITGVDVRLACLASEGTCGGTVEFHLDSVAGPLAATATVPSTGGWQNWQTVSGTISGAPSGVHDVYLVFKANSTKALGNVNWFQFR
ncbi:MAG TPA: carbohydrate-binding protein, partial [Terriglobales bacterium]|nr:carbohydrate-binding protein [Terriglobales bacterium]